MSEKLQQIKDEYAQKEYGYIDWAEFLTDNRDRPKAVEKSWAEVCRRYVTACCKATQEKISKQFGGEPFFINKVMAPDNIVLL